MRTRILLKWKCSAQKYTALDCPAFADNANHVQLLRAVFIYFLSLIYSPVDATCMTFMEEGEDIGRKQPTGLNKDLRGCQQVDGTFHDKATCLNGITMPN